MDEESGEKYYVHQIQSLPEYDKTTIYVDFNHVWKFDEDLGQVISNQYYRMEPYLRKAVQNAVRIHAPEYVFIKTGGQSIGSDSIREFWISWYGLAMVKK